jgi:hypothetical protein
MLFSMFGFRDRGGGQLGGLENRICFGDRGSNLSGGLECNCGSRSSTGDKATSGVGDRGTSRCWRMKYLHR